MFDYCNYRLFLMKFLVKVLMFHEVHLSQMNPFGLAKVCQFELACRSLDSDPDLDVFQALYKLNRSGDWYTFEVRKKNACYYSWITTSLKDWKDRFFLVDARCVLATMAWSYGLKESLRLKSFDSTELDIRATRTPKGDPPYINVVKENLYAIREHVATTGQGGLSSAPLANVIPVQVASVLSGDKGKNWLERGERLWFESSSVRFGTSIH
ncbi:hypothetical protein HanRHA438_Chr13g0585361 [Helianthus annuus]|uniref:Uncharacterized protein n=1 Tax=Helianthus annuus TaxID=4232 RepID=A0A9K3H9S6_HELAN|nr:hypothetical protein HanXRQr2_Chr13g0574481 [Helianthus annuus]KAJ0475874.1 hypothetical protein HanHA300_Chr13g0470681 [Helianthus annuus]KAJ0479893.1 hypothetical protein HanIR_Chr13g0625301 [Helianthus annuus]KAJ0496673.1 hypothetical protein HanHA89_Chr13g0502501 [Helianthus annuus]KAJ0848087.1 hypothetical protein HanPSC8_Chr13g0553061 [Helianthus annuus]